MADVSEEVKLLTELKASIEAQKGTQAAEVKELKGLIDAQAKAEVELKAEVAKLNTELATKDAKIGEVVNEVKEMKAKNGRFPIQNMNLTENKAIEIMMMEKIEEKKAEIAASEKGRLIEPIELKASVITTASFTGTNAPYRSYLDWQPGMEPTGQFRFRNLVRTIQSDTDNVSFPRAATPIGTGSFGKQVNETDTKAQVDRSYAMIDVLCKATAAFTIVSRASLRNIRFLQSWLPTSLMEQLQDTEDLQFANALVAAATGSASTTGITPAPVNSSLKTLVAAIKNQITAKFNPGTVVCDPNFWANQILNVETNAGFSLPNVVVVDPSGNVRVLGRVIQPVNWLTGNRVLVGDWSRAAIVQSEGLMLRQSDSHASIFSANQIAFLLERTEELATFRPDAFTTFIG